MNIDLSGKTALVTASTAGIGFAIAEGLARAGARVALNGRTSSSVDDAKKRLLAQVPNADVIAIAADLADADGVAKIREVLDEIDILVNNAGIYGPQDFFETGDEIWERYFQVNVMSGVRLSRTYLPAMEARGWGRVVFISSESALNIPADMIHYGVTKTGQLSVARGLAKRMAGTGVTVNSVLPGPTLSEGLQSMLKDQAQQEGRDIESVATDFVMQNRPSSVIQRAATPEEVANMVVYVCSQQASATSGAALRVDGGVVDDIV
ncbi:SDR family NAD(P)-dependent oxidoreductase [Pseudomonas matsuisoli]|uniref:Oxidoreductase n=1 Tax=Pseudomonas matsuisoli TaxID=1515666 RepID=A0A917PVW4_9PSED|nr:SDR family oxidoreductase [Pseudomonas matsuisoli]GGJ95451.1 oxidoreductase [Pseudomonas matsuisoli]